jgi:hypothetical protein
MADDSGDIAALSEALIAARHKEANLARALFGEEE